MGSGAACLGEQADNTNTLPRANVKATVPVKIRPEEAFKEESPSNGVPLRGEKD
jgi:hypothetical protein